MGVIIIIIKIIIKIYILYPYVTLWDNRNNHNIHSTNTIKRYTKQIKKICNEYMDFYVENPHTNCEDKKPWGLRPLI